MPSTASMAAGDVAITNINMIISVRHIPKKDAYQADIGKINALGHHLGADKDPVVLSAEPFQNLMPAAHPTWHIPIQSGYRIFRKEAFYHPGCLLSPSPHTSDPFASARRAGHWPFFLPAAVMAEHGELLFMIR